MGKQVYIGVMTGSTSPHSAAKSKAKTVKTASSKPHAPFDWDRAGAIAFELNAGATLDQIPKGAQVLVVAETKAAAEALSKASAFRRIRKPGSGRGASIETAASAALTRYRTQYRESIRRLMKEAFEPGPRARAILRGVENAEKDLKDAGGAFEVEDVRKLLHGVSRQAIDKRVKDGTLLAVPGPSGRRGFPAIQFQPDGAVVPGLKAVQAALGYTSPWSVLSFLVNPHDLLGGQPPIDVLRRGEVAPVEQAARLSGVHAE